MAPTSSPTSQPTFHQFTRLPPELQLRVWHFSLPTPRIIDIFALPITEKLQERLSPTKPCNPDPHDTTWVRTFVERVYCSPYSHPQLLHVNRQTRALVFQNYVRVDSEPSSWQDRSYESKEAIANPNGVETIYSREIVNVNGERSFVLIDPSSDILFLQDPPTFYGTSSSEPGPKVSSLKILVRWLDPAFVGSVRRLAIPYYSWRKTRITGSLEILRLFKGVRELHISFLGGEKAGGWADDLGDVEGHMKEVEREILEDVRVLEREFEGWERPVVRFVKHRGLLAEQLNFNHQK